MISDPKKIRFTFWETMQFAWLERAMKRRLSIAEKCVMVVHFGWRNGMSAKVLQKINKGA